LHRASAATATTAVGNFKNFLLDFAQFPFAIYLKCCRKVVGGIENNWQLILRKIFYFLSSFCYCCWPTNVGLSISKKDPGSLPARLALPILPVEIHSIFSAVLLWVLQPEFSLS